MTIVSEGVQVKPGGWERTGGMTGEFLVTFDAIAEVSTNDDPDDLARQIRAAMTDGAKGDA